MEANTESDLKQFTIRQYHQKRLNEYCKRMSQDNTTVLFDDNVADMLTAQGYSIQESPRSVYRVDKLYKALSKYAPGRIRNPRPDAHLHAGERLARICYSKPKDLPYLEMLPFTPETVIKVTSNPTGSAGLTAYGCTKQSAQTRALERGLQTLSGEKAPEPCLAFSRTQFNDKTRLVWGYPYSMTVIEGLVAKPLIERFKGGTTPMAFAMTTVALGTKLRVASYHRDWAYSIDMSSFDSSIAASLIHRAFKILRTWFDQQAVEPVSGKTCGEVFDLIERYFIHTPIVMPNSKLYLGKRHGVPSGSFFTQIVDSIVNTIIAGTISSRFNFGLRPQDVFVLGDDLLVWTKRDISLEKIASFASSYFGVEFNPAKSAKFHWDETIHYLGRDWDKGVPDLSEEEIIKRMVYPERFRKYSKDYEERRRQVRMLILSFASVYRSGWGIANRLLGTDMWNKQGGAGVDCSTYYRGNRVLDLDPDFQSGLERYLSKYIRSRIRGDIPNTAMQLWL